jgi:hypothetical protein
MKSVQRLIESISEISESSEQIASESGDSQSYRVFRRENLGTLKKLAPRHYPALVNAFNATQDPKERALLCECLQYAGARELQQLFEKLLNQTDPELRCCAMVALGRLGSIHALDSVYAQILKTGDRSTRFFLGCALVHARDKRAISLFVSVLREELATNQLESDNVMPSFEGTIYSHTIDCILGALIDNDSEVASEDPFAWIAWWDGRGDDIGAVDPTRVPAHLVEYTHDMMGEIYQKGSH